MREERVLSVPSAHADSTRVAVTDLDVHIAHRGVERAGTRVTWRAGTTSARIDAWCCCRCTARSYARARAGEEDHVLFLRLVGVARRVLAKHEHRPRRTKSDHSNSSPHIHGCRQPVTTRGNEDNTFPGGFLHLVNSELQCLSIVGNTVGVHREVFRREIDSLRIVES